MPRPCLGKRRFRREDGDARRGWKTKFTVNVTVICDDLSSYFLFSNDSNGWLMGRKLIKGLGMRGDLALENGVFVRPGQGLQVAREAESRPQSVVILLGWLEF